MDYHQAFFVADGLRALGEEQAAASLLGEAISHERRALYDHSCAYQAEGAIERQIRQHLHATPHGLWAAYLYSALGDNQSLLIAAKKFLTAEEAPLVTAGIRFLGQLVTEGDTEARNALLAFLQQHPDDIALHLDVCPVLGVVHLRSLVERTANPDYQRQALKIAAQILSGTWKRPQTIAREIGERYVALSRQRSWDDAALSTARIG